MYQIKKNYFYKINKKFKTKQHLFTLYCYKKYRFNIGFMVLNKLFLNIISLMNYILKGFKLQNLKISNNLKNFKLTLILSKFIIYNLTNMKFFYYYNKIKLKNFFNKNILKLKKKKK